MVEITGQDRGRGMSTCGAKCHIRILYICLFPTAGQEACSSEKKKPGKDW